ncbi:hypothetical protein [Brevundimonas sp.]|uniref:hypothetical protein n=1 Tax=Brevundimonas sp. TaxID=1871086 RepID=UPI00289D5D84|nr:hypothetical protein [Brevundimonas sp.]
MDDFEVASLENFAPREALERMLVLLLALFDDISDHKRSLLVNADLDAIYYHLEEAYPPALALAREDIRALINTLQTVDFSLEEKEHLRMNGPMLRLNMMAIKAAFAEARGVHPVSGYSDRRGWALYNRALTNLFDLMDEPLRTLTHTTDGPHGALMFKATLRALLNQKSVAP